MLKEFCEPELDDKHRCFVIGGNVTIFLDEGADSNAEEISAIVQNLTKDAMLNDNLLTDDNNEVKKVKYLDDEGGDGIGVDGVVDKANGSPPIGVTIGASLMALAGLIGFYLVKRQLRKFEVGAKLENDADEVVFSPASYIRPNSRDLGKVSSMMDVHMCQSAVCPKCYENPTVAFIRTHPYALKKDARSPSNSEISVDTMQGGISSDDSASLN